ncbi:hypothetical protein MMC28_000679 [Mycoblastus sanguinarius]|nr:hypothetical protein [Mycoblastus sanguinarius]
MPVNWKDPDAFTRLLAAMVAAQDMKLDYRKIASMYGNGMHPPLPPSSTPPIPPPISSPNPPSNPPTPTGATYDSIEGRFRIIRKEAAVLKSEVDSGARPAATPKKPKTTTTTTTPKKDKTLGGRVGKPTNGTPTKKGGGNVIKGVKEEPGSSASSFFSVGEGAGEGGDGQWGEGMMIGLGDAAAFSFGMDEGV